ncbi:hypothetical protein OG474_41690 [Kribbella sp. NBC_01505]|uniref:RHS repeat domain-containing protein n=1 Tax=Kribbella sp. NBC_01505 TaxID=2903580 RepID=UPI003870C41D
MAAVLCQLIDTRPPRQGFGPEGNGRKWDVLGRITEEATTKFTYDAMDLRRTVQNTAGTKKLSWDINNPLPMLGVETRTDGSLWRHRYAPDGTPVYVEHPGKSYPRSLTLADGMGSITDIVDQAAAARWRYSYEPFGAKRTSEKLNTVAEDPGLGFTGAYLESTTGNYHLRARDLNPTGMFVSPDPLTPSINAPSITPYAYANQRPTLLSDPSGLSPWGDFWDGIVETGKKIGEFGLEDRQTQSTQLVVGVGGAIPQAADSQMGTTYLSESYYGWTEEHLGVDGSEGGVLIGENLPYFLIPGGGLSRPCKLLELGRTANVPGKVVTTGAPKALTAGTSALKPWLRGTNGNAGLIPDSVRSALSGRTFTKWPEFREEFWKAVASDPALISKFKPENVAQMRNGNAPFVHKTQRYGGRERYEIHHRTPKSRGGAEFDLDNLVVVTPRYHAEVLNPSYHYGGGR